VPVFLVRRTRRTLPTVARLLLVACAVMLSTACARETGQPSLIDDLRSADLSAKKPQTVRQPSDQGKDVKTAPKYEVYPGDTDVARKAATVGTGAQRQGAQRAGDGYQLSFDNASLVDVTKVILSDTLQMQYFFDPRVQGNVTLSTGRPVTRNELLSILESALKLNNAALVRSGQSYSILPAAEAAASAGGATSFVKAGEPLQPGYGISVLPLRHVAADAMMRMLENFAARGGSLRTELSGNLLMIRGTAAEREALVEVAASFDQDWLKGQSAAIFPLQHATPDDMITELGQIMQSEQGDLMSKQVRFQPVHRLNAVLALARRPEHLRSVAEWVRRLDKSSAAGQSLYVYHVENSKAGDLAQILNDVLGSGGGSRTTKRSARSEVAPGRDASSLSSRSFNESGGGGFNRNGGGAGGPGAPGAGPGGAPSSGSGPGLGASAASSARIAAQSSGTSSPGGGSSGGGGGDGTTETRIIADENNNSLLIKASPTEYQRILSVIRQIDKPPLQVHITATIAEVTLNDSLKYGVQAFFKSSNPKLGGGFSNHNTGTTGPLPLPVSTPGLNLILGAIGDPRVVLDALSDVTDVKVVSSPSVVVVDNQPAVLKVGDEVPVTTQQSQSTDNPNAPVVNSIKFRDTGVILKVTPRVNSNGLVTMDVEQEISAVVNQGDAISLTPTISQRRIASTVSVYSNQMVVLGGLISEQTNKDRQGVPILNKIPLLGDAFGSTKLSTKRTELIVFIRPQVIRDAKDAGEVAEELRSRLKSMAFPQAPTAPQGEAAGSGRGMKDAYVAPR
jgi:general secretion pathway protein D